MQRLRTTFTRSRTPTGAEMKTQTSLEVPKQKVRSASFDEIQLENQRSSVEFKKQHTVAGDDIDKQTISEGNLKLSHYIHQPKGSIDFDDTSDTSKTFLEVPFGNSSNENMLISGGDFSTGQNFSTSFSTLGNTKKSTFVGRRASASATGRAPPSCWHCFYLEEYIRQVNFEQRFFIDHHELKSLSCSDSSSSSNNDSDNNNEDDNGNDDNADNYVKRRSGKTLVPPSLCNIKFTLSPTNCEKLDLNTIEISNSPPVSPVFYLPTTFLSSPPPSPKPSIFLKTDQQIYLQNYGSDKLDTQTESIEKKIHLAEKEFDDKGQDTSIFQFRPRRRSISRQEAIFVEPPNNSLENVASKDNTLTSESFINIKISYDEKSTELSTSTSIAFEEQEVSVDCLTHSKHGLPILMTETLSENVHDIYLIVPDLKRDRAASVDSCFSKVSSAGKTEELQPAEPGCFLSVPNVNATRSRSVDIVLPTDEQARYKALALNATGIYRKSSGGGNRQIRIVPDWSENAINGDHLWMQTSVSGDLCCVPEECRKNGQRMKCSACQLIAHLNCIPIVNEKTQLACKPTFRDVGIRQYREQTQTHHHWVHRRAEKSKCKTCGKTMQGKLFGSKEVVGLVCAWCKTSYHNKESCFNPERIGEECSLGTFQSIIVPPSWIVKLPTKGNFKSSLRTPKKRAGTSKKKEKKEKEHKAFIIKPIPSASITPVIVFINPKSGGNQGVKLLGKFQWILNPRQVFDLTQGGPTMGLELFRKAPQLRILACGGDGTVGWVLSILDLIDIQPPPAVGVLPLGTGNDLARALGWGGGYTDEPIGKILLNIGKSDPVMLDRWRLNVTPNPNAESTDDGKDNLPLNVVNNYFSFGVDAAIALEFHEAREAHPERFNSRIRNKMFYGQAGGKDLLQRKWRALSDCVTLECDGQDFTPKLKDHRVHAILFLNIPSYGGGTHPWNNSAGQPPATDDGLIEVVGLTTYQLPMLQAGAHGTCICQCKTAKIITTKTIPMQVDGEACRVKPCIIELSLLNKALLLAKRKRGRPTVQISGIEPITLNICRITMPDYEQHHHDKEMLKQTSNNLGSIQVEPVADLEQVRNTINCYLEDSNGYPKLSQEWCFVDSCTAERFFRIDRAQEHLHYIMDIANEEVFVLDQECATMPQTPDQERSFAVYQQKQEQRHGHGRISDSEGEFGMNSNSRISTTSHGHPNVKAEYKMKSSLLEKTSDAVLVAARIGDLQMLRALYEQGFSLLSIDQYGQTALHYGSRFNNKNIIKFMISCAPRSIINMVDNNKGQTALHIAAAFNYREISVMLVAAGASLLIRDLEGYTPMMVAFNVNAHDLAAYLESQERFYGMDFREKF